jgi:hypothetical protein
VGHGYPNQPAQRPNTNCLHFSTPSFFLKKKKKQQQQEKRRQDDKPQFISQWIFFNWILKLFAILNCTLSSISVSKLQIYIVKMTTFWNKRKWIVVASLEPRLELCVNHYDHRMWRWWLVPYSGLFTVRL